MLILWWRFFLQCHLEQHKTDPGFECEYCYFHFDLNDKELYKKHESLHKDKPAYTCVICDEHLNNPQSLRRHAKRHVCISM